MRNFPGGIIEIPGRNPGGKSQRNLHINSLKKSTEELLEKTCGGIHKPISGQNPRKNY